MARAVLPLLIMATLILSVGGTSLTLTEFLKARNYDRVKLPEQGNKTVVKIDAYVDSFGKIEEVNMELDAFMYLRQMWTDSRLAGFTNETLTLNREEANLVWQPDTYCINARQSDMMKPDKELHSALRLSPDGSIFYSRNTHVVASCDMDLHDFPMDVQHCDLSFGSYGLRTDALDYEWKEETIFMAKTKMAQFSVRPIKLSRRVDKYSTGNYTSVSVTFMLSRHVGYYMIQLYLPCLFLVMLSWIVFWMSPENGGDRLTVGITCILTIVFLLGYVNSMLPKVSYAKGVDWYLMTSFFFIFLALAECVLIEKMMCKPAEKEPQKDQTKDDSASPGQNGKTSEDPCPEVKIIRPKTAFDSSEHGTTEASPVDENMVEVRPSRNRCAAGITRKILALAKSQSASSTAAKVDKLSRLLFPLSYALYNAGYWYVYLNGVDVLD